MEQFLLCDTSSQKSIEFPTRRSGLEMQGIQSFPPQADSISRCYHYHHGSDLGSENADSFWTWMVNHRSCKRVLSVNAGTSTIGGNSELPDSSEISSNGTSSRPTVSSKMGNLAPFFDFGCSIDVLDAENRNWTISANLERTACNELVSCREYTLCLQSANCSARDMKNSNAQRTSKNGSPMDYTIKIFELSAAWNVNTLPSIAEFRKKVTTSTLRLRITISV